MNTSVGRVSVFASGVSGMSVFPRAGDRLFEHEQYLLAA